MSKGLFVSLYSAGKPFALIDARERRDFVNGQWFGSINVPLSGLTEKITRMLPDRDFPIHLLDWGDRASSVAADRLAQLGYEDFRRCASNLPQQYGAGFVKGEYVWSKAFGEVVAHTCGLLEVTPSQYLDQYPDALLFDVRPTAEYRQFTIPTSQSLPNSLMLGNMEALKKAGQMALLHCAGRTRSIIGASTLKAAGYEGPFAIFKGGTQSWQLDGHRREHNADRLFAGESNNSEPILGFLHRWEIPYQQIDDKQLESVIASHRKALLFDVSDDAARGGGAEHGIIRVSGTNLIQQTDQWIARFHVPVVLFDHGSGSRAAFAAYWLSSMGFQVHVALLQSKLADYDPEPGSGSLAETSQKLLTPKQVADHLKKQGQLFDFRSSAAYRKGRIQGSVWKNIGSVLTQGEAPTSHSDPVIVVGKNHQHCSETASLLEQIGWSVAGVHVLDMQDPGPLAIAPAEIEMPIDQSALFAGRHRGNFQDSRDYLAWEEELPEQIDQQLTELWTDLLGRSPAN